jgi:hypothetical protein
MPGGRGIWQRVLFVGFDEGVERTVGQTRAELVRQRDRSRYPDRNRVILK